MDTDKTYGDTIEDIVNFVFPPILHHPLAAARLICYGNYGPLIDGELRSGMKGKHVINTWEMSAMCLQIEREDILSIYLHKGKKFEVLNKAEQDDMINQADAHLKKAKGRASLPQITKHDVRELLNSCKTQRDGIVSFHEVQNKIFKFRDDRIRQYKLVYPNLCRDNNNDDDNSSQQDSSVHSRSQGNGSYTSTASSTVSPNIVNSEMFLKNVGQTDPERIAETGRLLSKHAFRVCDIEGSSNPALTTNVRLLRDVGPVFSDPYVKYGRRIKNSWDDTSNLKSSQVGSMVVAVPSSSTWKRKATLG
eukprot:gene10659-22250_t